MCGISCVYFPYVCSLVFLIRFLFDLECFDFCVDFPYVCSLVYLIRFLFSFGVF